MKIRKNYAFTVFELTMVLAIITIMVVMIFPVLQKARETGRKASCVSNLKQIGTALSMYLDDYRHSLPQVGNDTNYTWHWILNRDYIDDTTLFACPSFLGTLTAFSSSMDDNDLAYGANLHVWGYDLIDDSFDFSDAWEKNFVPYDPIVGKPDKILVADNNSGSSSTYKNFVRNNPADPIGNRHNGGANILFVDFHVGWMHKGSIDGKGDAWWEYQ